MIPLIGLTTYAVNASWGSWTRPAAVLPESYFELVAAAGGRPILLPPPHSAAGGPGAAAAEVIDVLDGLVLTGGGDIDPAAYGEQPDPAVAGVNPTRDESERALLVAALAADLPVLAICRGLQVLNVELGGTLYQHLPDVAGVGAHRTPPMEFAQVHVTTEDDSRVAAIFGSTATVSCSHHQAIDRLGQGLTVTARADDGVIEAVELEGAQFVMGVQWHPEEGQDQRPFDALIAAARAYHRDRPIPSRAQ
jgi:gamma-glutamyl-gamma-aminobutyrate hydrolase PuuD